MRIGFISTYPPIECGIATYTQYLSDALRKKQNDVYVVCHRGGAGHQVFPSFDYEDGDLAEKAFSTMVRFTPDVVHIQHEFGLFGRHLGVSVIPLILKFRIVGIPVVTTLHTVYADIPEDHILILRNILYNSDRVIIHEPYQERTLRHCFGSDLVQRVKVIPHGAREVEPVPDAKAHLDLPPDKKVILLIGYFRPSKNFELVVDIFPDILNECPDTILLIAGKTRGREHIDYRNMLFAKIADSPHQERIWLIRGQLPQPTFDTILSASDVVVLPYKISSQSGILAHCLAFGKPVVTSRTEAMEEIIRESKAGVVCENRSQFTGQIVRLLSDNQLAETLSKNARTYVRNVVSWSKVAEEHMRLYRGLLEMPKVKTRVLVVE